MNSNTKSYELINKFSEVDKLIKRYQLSTKNAVESILNMGEAVFEVHTKAKTKELSESDLEYFCKSVNLDAKSSTFRKYKTIGQNANRFREVMDKLPATFSVLYEMATLSGDDFERLVMNKSYSKGITLDQFKKMLHKSAVLTRNKMMNPPVILWVPGRVSNVIKQINKFNISIARDISEMHFNEIIETLTAYRNKGYILFDDPVITECISGEL